VCDNYCSGGFFLKFSAEKPMKNRNGGVVHVKHKMVIGYICDVHMMGFVTNVSTAIALGWQRNNRRSSIMTNNSNGYVKTVKVLTTPGNLSNMDQQ